MRFFPLVPLGFSLLATPSLAALKDVFAHYLVGTMTSAEALTDVQQAKALGFDAFALNIQDIVDSWATSAISSLFTAAEQEDFKLFFSFDMSVQSEVSYYLPIFLEYYQSSAYYYHNSLPFLSTFYGATLTFGSATPNAGWQSQLRDVLSAQGISIYFLPAFSDAPNGPTNFFSTYPVVDGVFSWDSAWPYVTDGNVNVSSTTDQEYLSGAKATSKTFMMPLSSVQFKHLSGANYYRKGEVNMGLRIGQVLDLAPDFLEIITWNDAGESHYIGNIWPESIAGTAIPAYSDGYDHSAWQALIPPLIKAYKAETTDLTTLVPATGTISGAFWYRPLLTTGSCSSDSLGLPDGASNAQDVVNIALFISTTGNAVTVYSGNNQIALYQASKGLNVFQVPGLVAGPVSVNVWDSTGSLTTFSASSVDVVTSMSICNYNYQVVSVAA